MRKVYKEPSADGPADFLVLDDTACDTEKVVGGERLILVYATSVPGQPVLTETHVASSYVSERCSRVGRDSLTPEWMSAVQATYGRRR
jgi:hypothetical protein